MKNKLAYRAKRAAQGPIEKNIVFLAKFSIIFFSFYALLLASDLNFFENAITGFQASMLNLPKTGNLILTENANYKITESCTGLLSIIILGSTIFSLKKPEIKIKFKMLLIGSLALVIINLIRVYFVLLAGITFNPLTAETLHIVSWFVMSGLILMIWLEMTKKIAKEKDFSKLI